MSQTPALTIHLSGDEVDAIISDFSEYFDAVSELSGYKEDRHHHARRQLLERLHGQLNPEPLTVDEVKERG